MVDSASASDSFDFFGPYAGDDIIWDDYIPSDSFRNFLNTLEPNSPDLQETINPADLNHTTPALQSPQARNVTTITHPSTYQGLIVTPSTTAKQHQHAAIVSQTTLSSVPSLQPLVSRPSLPQSPSPGVRKRFRTHRCMEPGCQYTTTTLKELDDHIRDIHKLSGFKCPYCDTRVTRHDNLTSHYRACKGITPANDFLVSTTAKGTRLPEAERSVPSTETTVATAPPRKRRRVNARTLLVPPAPDSIPTSTVISTTTASTSTSVPTLVRPAPLPHFENPEKAMQATFSKETHQSLHSQQHKGLDGSPLPVQKSIDNNNSLVLSSDALRRIVARLSAKIELLTTEEELLNRGLRKATELLAQEEGERDFSSHELVELIKSMVVAL
ncbi:hypothetical protein ABW20_dc0102326 [Dactylellina cionopaga]|nr:hypothetical protein ABW20_dc0102326 [Dactylellina cionopaga]